MRTEAVGIEDQFRRRAEHGLARGRRQSAPVWALIKVELNRLPAWPDDDHLAGGRVQARARRAGRRAEAVGGGEREGTRADGVRPSAVLEPVS